MAPHAEESSQGNSGGVEIVTANGSSATVNDGEAPLEPGVKKNVAHGKMAEFPR